MPNVPNGDHNEIHVRLAGGFPRTQLDRLLRQLEPVLTLRDPAIVHLDLEGLVFFGPTAQAVVAAAFHRVIDDDLVIEGSNVFMPQSKMVYRYLQRMDFFEGITGPQLAAKKTGRNTKRCRHCGTEEPASEFRRNARCRDGLSSWCALCHTAATRRRREEHPERVREINESRRVVPARMWRDGGWVENPDPRPKSRVW